MLCAAILLVAFARPASAQWPTVMMFYGGSLTQPVFATGADTPPFSGFVGGVPAPNQATANDMGNRPYVNVAWFWGPRDDPAQNGTRTLDALKPEMAFHHGRLYPSTADKPAMLFMMSLQVKGRDVYGMMKLGPGGQPVSRGNPIPTDPAAFSVGRPLTPPALAVLQRLGVAALKK